MISLGERMVLAGAGRLSLSSRRIVHHLVEIQLCTTREVTMIGVLNRVHIQEPTKKRLRYLIEPSIGLNVAFKQYCAGAGTIMHLRQMLSDLERITQAQVSIARQDMTHVQRICMMWAG
jgi:hypothetical protein